LKRGEEEGRGVSGIKMEGGQKKKEEFSDNITIKDGENRMIKE